MTTQWSQSAEQNMESLKQNAYPGRGIVIGQAPDGQSLVQVYWIMGRSENSRNRIFIMEDNGFVRTEAKDPAKLIDPSLIIYYPVKALNGSHIVTNGDQTDTIYDTLSEGGTFEQALTTRTYEPDGPNFTPRISGLIELNNKDCAYKLSILKSNSGSEAQTQRHFFHYEQGLPGFGHLIHTYEGDGNPLPSFKGEPVIVPLYNDIDQTASAYWERLNADNKLSLLVKSIRLDNGQTDMRIINK
jgi:IMP cyclohydrolase